MIKYSLECKCGEQFYSWFKNSEQYDELLKKNLISCYVCGSRSVKKSLMAPNVAMSKNSAVRDNDQKKEFYANVQKKLKDLKEYVEKNAEYVGDKFVSEVRSIHYDNKKKRSIYGTASPKETKDLLDEGIDIISVPWIKRNN
jgi:hypothetical protein